MNRAAVKEATSWDLNSFGARRENGKESANKETGKQGIGEWPSERKRH